MGSKREKLRKPPRSRKPKPLARKETGSSMSDNVIGGGINSFTTTSELEPEDRLLLQLRYFKKENAELKVQLVEARAKVATLEAQVNIMNLKQATGTVEAELSNQIAALTQKYGLDLSVDKIDLDRGIITRAQNQDEEGD